MLIYMYVKQCLHCQKLYFGRTESKNPLKYPGSGEHWSRHIKKHNAQTTTIKLWKFTSQEQCTRYAQRFSSFYGVGVDKDTWFNLIPEDGKRQGLPKGAFLAYNTLTGQHQITTLSEFSANPELVGVNRGRKYSDRQREARSNLYRGAGNPNYGKKSKHLETYNKIPRRWVTNGIEDHLVGLDVYTAYKKRGFWNGRTQSNNKGTKHRR